MAKKYKCQHYPQPASLMGEDARRHGLHVLARLIARHYLTGSLNPVVKPKQLNDRDSKNENNVDCK